MSKQYYFAYGSNLPHTLMHRRCPDSERCDAGTIENYSLSFGAGGYANIRECKGAVVCGAVFEISPSDVRRLDYYEGYPHLYDKRTVEVQLENGETVEALVYLMPEKYAKQKTLPSEGYIVTVLQGYRDWGLPHDVLVDALKTVKKAYNGGGVSRDALVELVEDARREAVNDRV